MRKVLSIIISLLMILSVVPASFAASNDIGVVIIENGMTEGKLLSKNQAPSYTVAVQNKSAEAKNATVVSSIVNISTNITVWTETKTINLSANREVKLSVCPTLGANAFGKLKFVVDATIGTNNATDEKEFYRINGADNVTPNVGFNTYKILSTDWSILTTKDYQRILSAGGFGMVRESLEWMKVEKSKGIYKIPDGFKEYLKAIKDMGGRPLLTLMCGNQLYADTTLATPLWRDYSGEYPVTDLPRTEASRQAFANYVNYIVDELDGIVEDIEIWNEPDSKGFNKYGTPNDYVLTLSAVKSKIGTKAKIVGMATSSVSGGDQNQNNHIWSAQDTSDSFMKEVVRCGGLQYMDYISFHRYPYLGDDIGGEKGLWEGSFDDAMTNAVDICGTSKPFIITEYGYYTDNAQGTVTNPYGDKITELQKAKFISRTLPLIKSINSVGYHSFASYGWSADLTNVKIEGITYYSLANKIAQSDSQAIEKEWNYGSFYADKTPKLDYITNAFSTKMFANATNAVKSVNNKIMKIAYKLNGDNAAAFWTTDGSKKTTSISFSSKSGYSLKLYDMYGNLIQTYDSNSATINVSDEIVYAVYTNKADVASVTGSAPAKIINPIPYQEESCLGTSNITVNNGVVSVSGTLTEGKYVAVVASELESAKTLVNGVNEKIAYVSQCNAQDGNFNVSFNLPKDKIYIIRCSAGNNKDNIISTDSVDLHINTSVDDKVVESYSNLSGNKASVNVKVDRCLNGLSLVGAVYNSTTLESVSKDIYNGTNQLNITVNSSNTSDKMSLFMWDSNMRPLFNKIDVLVK